MNIIKNLKDDTGHNHTIEIPQNLQNRIHKLVTSFDNEHDHIVVISLQQIKRLKAGKTIDIVSSSDMNHNHKYRIKL